MSSFNQIIILGNTTRDPQTKHLASNTTLCEWGMACNRKFTVNGEQREEVMFIDCVAFGKLAEIVAQYVTKGKPLMVIGRLKYDVWDDKLGGGKRSKHSIVAENVQFIGGREAAQPVRGPAKPVDHNPEPDLSEPQFTESDIPFASAHA